MNVQSIPKILQLSLPEDVQTRMGHTATALCLGSGKTQVTMFGGCLKFELEKSNNAQEKIANTTLLEFGKQNLKC